MAIYHLSMKPISRGSGRSAVAAAAYRAAEVLENERDGLVHDFTRRSGVEHAEIVLPAGVAADWARDRSALWNAAEAAEKRKDARVAREIEVALPHELDRRAAARSDAGFARELADRYGVAVDFAIHSPHGAYGCAQPPCAYHDDDAAGWAGRAWARSRSWSWRTSACRRSGCRHRMSSCGISGSGLGRTDKRSIWRGPGWISGSTIARTRSGGSRSSRRSIWACMPRRWSGGTSRSRGCGSTRPRRSGMPI